MATSSTGPAASRAVESLVRAVNSADLDALTSLFAEDYVNETPAHPARSFTGREQVRRNWAAILGGVKGLSAEIIASAVDGNRVWSEWRMSGVRHDGSAHEMAGVCIFTVRGDEITAARFYLEPVERGAGTIDDAVLRQVRGGAGS